MYVVLCEIAMSARDKYHDWVKETLINAGWRISHDPLSISIGKISIQIDLGLESLIGAEKGTEKIAVEIKSFGKVSQITDFYAALGQYLCYKVALADKHPERTLYLAVPAPVYELLFTEILIQKVLQAYPVKLLVYNLANKEIQSWID
jgi:XisH protein